MANKTPVKAASSNYHLCRCCNLEVKNNPIDLFGENAQNERFLNHLEEIAGLNSFDGDGFPRKICRNCYGRVNQFSEFRSLCLKSREKQEASLRFKRGKKATESPSVLESRVAKHGKQSDVNQGGSSAPAVRRNLQMFTPIYPKEKACETLHEQRRRTLPNWLQNSPIVQQSQSVVILTKAGLRNSEVRS